MTAQASQAVAMYPRFPSVEFISKAEFDEYFERARSDIDARYLYDLSFASNDPVVVTKGSCALCLRVAEFRSFTASGDTLTDGRRVPNWREGAVCDCRWQLPARFRAALHFLQSVTGVSRETRLLLFGGDRTLERPLREFVAHVSIVRRLVRSGERHVLTAPDASMDVAIALDALNYVPLVDDALAEIRRALAPGGQFVFSVPFNVMSQAISSRLDEIDPATGRMPLESVHQVHDFGWDLIERVRRAGFARCAAHLYRSEELGYLGVFNMIFAATA